MAILKSFYEEKEKFSEKERLLQETIQKRSSLIQSNDNQYKVLLIDGKEEEADELFKENSELKGKQESDSAKLSSYKQIHREALIKKAFEVLDNDLLELKDNYIKEYVKLLIEEKRIQEQLAKISNEKFELEQTIKRDFNKYDDLAEHFNLKEIERGRFNREPYLLIKNPSSRIYNSAIKKAK